ncbi:MAG: hypothetical protein ACK55Z_22535, partial [bacterium]
MCVHACVRLRAHLLVKGIARQQLRRHLDRAIKLAPPQPRQGQVHGVDAFERAPARARVSQHARRPPAGGPAAASAGGRMVALTSRTSTCRRLGPGDLSARAPQCS